jgi:hypothetical protein
LDCVRCGERPAFNHGHSDVRVCRECELGRHNTIVDGDKFLDRAAGELHPLTQGLFIALSSWRLAQTLDHEYTVRDLASREAHRSTCLSHDTFEWFVRHIREYGEPALWRGREYIYLRVGAHRYWTMGAPAEVTTIVNRAAVDH